MCSLFLINTRVKIAEEVLLMGIFDFLKVKQYKEKINSLHEELNEIKSRQLSMEQMTIHDLNEEIIKQKDMIKKLDEEVEVKTSIFNKLESEINQGQEKVDALKSKLVVLDNDIVMETFGLYRPLYDCANSLAYKKKLEEVRREQEKMIKDKTAVSYFENWSVNGSKSKGRKMTNDNIKQILRCFNNECEAAIYTVKQNNFQLNEKRIIKSFEELNKLNLSNKVSLTTKFLDLKLSELYLAYEYEKKKQEERETLRTQREREREEKILQMEIQTKHRTLDKEIIECRIEIDELNKELKNSENSDQNHSIEQRIVDLDVKIKEKQEEKEKLEFHKSNFSAGYVYIISNVGSFGEDVVKIGVTRRLDPLERINELGSVSVPFKFDMHALIFSEDAYKLQAELHQYFDSYRINKVNNRKEFFKVPIIEIKQKLETYDDLMIDFKEIAQAEEYRESLSISVD